jgi:nucleolar protein 58
MFQDSTKAKESLELLSFQPFVDTADAVSAITACQEGRVSSSLQQFLVKKMKKLVKKSSDYASIAVADKAMAVNIKQDVLSSLSSNTSDTKMKVVHDDKTAEIFRGIRCYLDDWLSNDENDNSNSSNVNISSNDIHKMQLGLSHSLGRYKLKFSADKVDTMIIQAVGLLDELDKEINTYAMRVKVSVVNLFCGES